MCIEREQIQVQTRLTDIFPRKTRRKDIQEIEKELYINLKALRPKQFITYTLLIVLITSIVACFFNKSYGLMGIAVSIVGFVISNKVGKEFEYSTLGELVEQATLRNYLKSRRQITSVNKKEIEKKLEKLFIEDLGLTSDRIDRATVIF